MAVQGHDKRQKTSKVVICRRAQVPRNPGNLRPSTNHYSCVFCKILKSSGGRLGGRLESGDGALGVALKVVMATPVRHTIITFPSGITLHHYSITTSVVAAGLLRRGIHLGIVDAD